MSSTASRTMPFCNDCSSSEHVSSLSPELSPFVSMDVLWQTESCLLDVQ